MPRLDVDYAARPQNILGLEKPDQWSCSLLSYGHVTGAMSRLVRFSLTSFPEPGEHVFGFSSVQYFEGPTYWQGANFCVASYDDCIDLMLQAGLLAEVPDDELDGWLDFIMPWTHLYTVETGAGFVVRLIADAVSYEKDD